MTAIKSAILSTVALVASATVSLAGDIALPSYVKDSGKLPIATTIYAPFSYIDENGKQVGLSIELAQAAAKELGVELIIDQVPFTSLIPSLSADRIKIAWLDATVTEERLKQADFVSWLQDGTIASTLPANKDKYAKRTALCGSTIAVQSGTSADFSADQLNKECKSAGLKEIKKDIYPSQQDTVQAVITGRADAYLDDATSAGYYSTISKGKLVLAGEVFAKQPVGHIIKKGDAETAKMLAAAIQKLIDDGTYKTILDKYGMSSNAIAKPVIYTDVSQLKN
ncbi:ABC transporter substrate-binding protein [Rhizobium sp. CCGE532]|uniref:ABC transporter substrate-binding protein n=2 Tax=unclassified Rhizobium TaxID=2613769 RepID=UPI001FE1DF45|nr:ABC transporter substrate-binding protein [Rhizobium sp. CCGE532]